MTVDKHSLVGVIALLLSGSILLSAQREIAMKPGDELEFGTGCFSVKQVIDEDNVVAIIRFSGSLEEARVWLKYPTRGLEEDQVVWVRGPFVVIGTKQWLGRTIPYLRPTSQKLTPEDKNSPDFRTWTDSTGKHEIKALYRRTVSIGEQGVVQLTREDGVRIEVPAAKLSQSDWEWITTKVDREDYKSKRAYTAIKIDGNWVSVKLSEDELVLRGKEKVAAKHEKERQKQLAARAKQAASHRDKHDLGTLGGYPAVLPPWNIGDYGRLCGGKCKVIQIVDEQNAICEMVVGGASGVTDYHFQHAWEPGMHMENMTTNIVWIRMNTVGKVDGQIYETNDVFKVTGTKQYQALVGTKTVYVLEKR